ncbi:prepilin-type N-terminal cleavage/methylation domain-containing protein [Candidatus Dependentiae bacterium]|nr:prepilin-type N-terminal cleavage/methylation domain-containing protein [Candidatus Dependentiae bacterium]
MEVRKGFTLVELMVVVAIIAFLSLIAVPNFMRYLAKAKRIEAYMNLSSLCLAQKTYFAEHGTYSSQLQGADGIGWKPEGYKGGGKQESFYYTYGFPGAEGQNHFTGKLETALSDLSSAYANKEGFMAYAVGDIDGDGEPDVLAIDQHNNITIVKDDLA